MLDVDEQTVRFVNDSDDYENNYDNNGKNNDENNEYAGTECSAKNTDNNEATGHPDDGFSADD